MNTAGNVRMFSPYLLCASLIFVYYPIYFIYSNSHSAITNLYLISNFTSCTLDLHHCFNWNSPCKNSTAIYIYPQNEGSWLDQSTLLRYLFSNVNDLNKFERRIEFALRSDPSFTITSDPTKACLFVPRIACLSVNSCAFPRVFARSRLLQLPYWDNGRNHILLDHGDEPFAHIASGNGAEIRMRSASSKQFYRENFDIAISLRPKMTTYGDVLRGGVNFASKNRPLLIGFLGAPTTNSQPPAKNLRMLLMKLHDPEKRIDVTVRSPKCKVPCQKHQPEYYQQYKSILLRSKFQLVPRGQGLHSHRLLESIASGSVPIILADNIVLPFNDLIPWEKAVIIVKEKNWNKVPKIALTHLSKVHEMQCAGLAIYRNFFLRPYGTINLSFRILQRNIRRNSKFQGESALNMEPLLLPWEVGKPVPKKPSFCTSSVSAQDIEMRVQKLNMET